MWPRIGVYLLGCILLVLGASLPSTAAQEGQQQQPADVINVELILDVSGSMAQVIETGETRMDAAKRVLNEVITAIPEQEKSMSACGFMGIWVTIRKPEKQRAVNPRI